MDRRTAILNYRVTSIPKRYNFQDELQVITKRLQVVEQNFNQPEHDLNKISEDFMPKK